MELSLVFKCPRCGKFQCRIVRFKAISTPTISQIAAKKRKIRLNCLYCSWKGKCIDAKPTRIINVENSSEVIQTLNKLDD